MAMLNGHGGERAHDDANHKIGISLWKKKNYSKNNKESKIHQTWIQEVTSSLIRSPMIIYYH